jgi:exosortase
MPEQVIRGDYLEKRLAWLVTCNTPKSRAMIAKLELKTGGHEQTADWLVWVKAAIVAVLIAGVYWEILPDLASEWWNQPEASYGMLIPPLAFYVAYLRAQTTFALPQMPDMRGLWLVFAGCCIFLTGGLAAEFFLSRISLVVVLAGLIWTFWGVPRLKTLIFPLVILATMVPPPGIVYNTVAAPLQLFASAVATYLAQAMGISIYRDGNIIYLATTSLGVAEACSGLRSLSALMVGSLLVGLLEGNSLLPRVLLFALSVPIAIIVNAVRVTGTAVLADFRPELAEGFYHSFSGWLVFVLGFGMLWMIGKAIFRWAPGIVK